MTYPYLRGKVALITGASRGIGAATALALAAQGADLVLNYRSKAGRAEKVAAAAQAHGVRALPVAADLTVRDDVRALVARTQQAFGRLDVLVLNASGGLEKEQTAANPDYAMLLNRDAQVWTLAEALSALHAGGRIVFVTSHWAHFYGQAWQYPIYEPVARSKHAGEQALLAQIPALTARDLRLVRVSGDVVEGTITPRLMEHEQPGMLAVRRSAAGWLPTVDDMAAAIVRAVGDDTLAQGAVLYVGETNVPQTPVAP